MHILTGCNSKYFLSACLLWQSLTRAKYDGKLSFLDFGLTTSEKEFLKLNGLLLDAPLDNGVNLKDHPWVLKTKIGRYIQHLTEDEFYIWIDSDILVSKSFPENLKKLTKTMVTEKFKISAAPAWTLEEFLIKFPDLYQEPFLKRLPKLKREERQYFNSGFIVFHKIKSVNLWDEVGKNIAFHGIYDQGVFNILAYEYENVFEIPRQLWNFHDTDFDDTSLINWNKKELTGDDKPYVIHLTSSFPHHFQYLDCKLYNNLNSPYTIRLSNIKVIRDLQFFLLDQFILEHSKNLNRVGMLSESCEYFRPIIWNASRNSDCPCLSGKHYKSCHGLLAKS